MSGGGQRRTLTVANLREPEGAGFLEVVFLESARFYRLPRGRAGFAAARTALRDALAAGSPVEVDLAAADSDEIVDIRPVAGR